MRSCLNQDELNQLLVYKIHNKPASSDIAYLCELADNWSTQIGALTYSLARVLESMTPEMNEEKIGYIGLFFSLPNTMYFEIQELDYKYINNLIRTVRLPNIPLEDELMQILINMMNHDFTKVIRY